MRTLLLALLLSTPIAAQDCMTPEHAAALVTREDGVVAGTIDYHGTVYDRLMITEDKDGIARLWGFKGGCLVKFGPWDALEAAPLVEDKGTPA